MYISEEQKMLEKIDADFRKKIKEAKAFMKDTLEGKSAFQKLEAIEELPKVQQSTYKSRLLKIENGVLIRSRTPSETVFIPAGVTEIGNEAFKLPKHLNTNIIFPDGLKKIGVSAFEDCGDILNMDVKDPDLCYYEGIWKDDVFGQFSRGFSQFPSSLEEIGDYAFRNFVQNANGFRDEPLMEYLILPQSLKYIGKGAFIDSGIGAAYIAGPQTVSEYCFSKSGLRKVVFGNNVKFIERIAFDACNRLEKIIFGKNIKEIGDYAFSYCIALKKLELPSSLIKIGKGTFSECGRLTSVELPDSVTEIGENAFSKCKDLKKVKIGKGLTVIPECCFSNCSKLKEVIIPDTVIQIAHNAFKNCSNFTIIGNIGSPAEQFAKENNIKFEAI